MPTEFKAGEFPVYIDADAPSNADGTFEFTRLAVREYRLQCRDGDIGRPASIRVPVTQKEPLITRLKPHQGARLRERGELVSKE